MISIGSSNVSSECNYYHFLKMTPIQFLSSNWIKGCTSITDRTSSIWGRLIIGAEARHLAVVIGSDLHSIGTEAGVALIGTSHTQEGADVTLTRLIRARVAALPQAVRKYLQTTTISFHLTMAFGEVKITSVGQDLPLNPWRRVKERR